MIIEILGSVAIPLGIFLALMLWNMYEVYQKKKSADEFEMLITETMRTLQRSSIESTAEYDEILLDLMRQYSKLTHRLHTPDNLTEITLLDGSVMHIIDDNHQLKQDSE